MHWLIKLNFRAAYFLDNSCDFNNSSFDEDPKN